ncbi:MAG: VOC family protein [Actinobacteria bacterium]|uniref:Unannotated protein n=1 Tax=freshwater metagenome TaxID=449393 RepID=A0A6J6PAH6_9ZZZZ|nr:VOC family protein [Actinomycetota bacterium]
MTTLLNPYLHFLGEAREAMEFYQSLFGGELSVMTYGDMGMEGDQADKVMHSQLAAGPLTLMGSDSPSDAPMTRGDMNCLSLSGDDDAQLRGWFEALSTGGEVHVPLEKQMWGDVFGQCKDRFGLTWLVNISEPA